MKTETDKNPAVAPSDLTNVLYGGISKDDAKRLATDFFYWWHNQPGTNTLDGFDEWWQMQQRAAAV